MSKVKCFKAYDIRGRVDDDLTEDIAFGLGGALADTLSAKTVVLGRDMRDSSQRLQDAICDGLMRSGVDVVDIGLCGTEEVYFATDHFAASAGIMVTASHNPIDYNGFKLVGPGATPLSDVQFRAIEAGVAAGKAVAPAARGTRQSASCRDAYVSRVISFADAENLSPFHMLANAGNGAAGPTFDAVLDGVTAAGAALQVTRLHHAPDPTFPNGIPNPLLTENQPMTAEATRAASADLGLAWDGDFDRCFFFDGAGEFIPGEYIVGVLAQAMLVKEPGARIVHDPRVMWNTQRVVREAGGETILSKTGHALVKARMREMDAAYGGEMSAHHYFRDFMYCDSGMIPWVLMLAQLSATGRTLRDTIADMRARHPSSGEINFVTSDAQAATDAVLAEFGDSALDIDWLDGLSLSFADWRVNLRRSNTEPLLRLNVEARDDRALVESQTGKIARIIERFPG